jgi:hypothetical protein
MAPMDDHGEISVSDTDASLRRLGVVGWQSLIRALKFLGTAYNFASLDL